MNHPISDLIAEYVFGWIWIRYNVSGNVALVPPECVKNDWHAKHTTRLSERPDGVVPDTSMVPHNYAADDMLAPVILAEMGLKGFWWSAHSPQPKESGPASVDKYRVAFFNSRGEQRGDAVEVYLCCAVCIAALKAINCPPGRLQNALQGKINP